MWRDLNTPDDFADDWYGELTNQCGHTLLGIAPAAARLRDIGQANRQVRNVYVGTQVLVGGTKVLGTQQAAIANDASGAANQATVNAILAALRAHGLIDN